MTFNSSLKTPCFLHWHPWDADGGTNIGWSAASQSIGCDATTATAAAVLFSFDNIARRPPERGCRAEEKVWRRWQVTTDDVLGITLEAVRRKWCKRQRLNDDFIAQVAVDRCISRQNDCDDRCTAVDVFDVPAPELIDDRQVSQNLARPRRHQIFTRTRRQVTAASMAASTTSVLVVIITSASTSLHRMPRRKLDARR